MTDAKEVRQLAEQLAKAQFAAKRNPHDCALLYVAMGKKTLLQVCRSNYSPKACVWFEDSPCTSLRTHEAAIQKEYMGTHWMP